MPNAGRAKAAGARDAKAEIVEGAAGAEAGREDRRARHPPCRLASPSGGPALQTAVPVPAEAALEPAGPPRGRSLRPVMAADAIEEGP